MTVALVRVPLLTTDQFAAVAGLHPDLARRLVALGLLEATRDASGELRFSASQISAAARIQRLRAGLALNYAAVGVVVYLLDRISELESALQARHDYGGRA